MINYHISTGFNFHVFLLRYSLIAGNSQVWHGQADILANGYSIAVMSGGIESAEDSPGRSQVEVKTEFKDIKHLENQVISQSVCFSFLQGQRHPEYINKLVPFIGISGSEILIFLYDSVQDKLVQSAPFRLFNQTTLTLKISCVIALWLTLNYKVFSSSSSSISAFVKKLPSADFFVVAKEKLNIYRKDLQFGKSSIRPVLTELYRCDGTEQEEELKGSEILKSLGITKQWNNGIFSSPELEAHKVSL